jgi:hypothetical protein
MLVPEPTVQTGTVLDVLLASLEKASRYNQNVMVAPAAILWTDKYRCWLTLAPVLRSVLPQFLTLGPYDPVARTGPAIWLKCMLAHKLPEANWPEEAIPILYLPGVSRQELRAVETCPKPLQPLAELQYRSVFWSHVNGRDWSVLAFLKSQEGGLGLDVAQDEATREAIGRALLPLMNTPLLNLQGRRLEADDFNLLLTPDPVRDLLRWLNDPAGTCQHWDGNEWDSFRTICQKEYGFDPQQDGELTGAELLGRKQGNWGKVWERFAEYPRLYSQLPELLRRAKPAAKHLFEDKSSWPQKNEEQETALRQNLKAMENQAPYEVAQKLTELEKRHGDRRHWVWAELGQAPLAQALEHITTLAKVTKQPMGGGTPEEMAAWYATKGWRADAAMLQTLACIQRTEDVSAVIAAIRTIYLPWLQAAAERLQKLVQEHSYPGHAGEYLKPMRAQEGECLLFSDGLRYDVAQQMQTTLAQQGFQVHISYRWASLPTVTATSKPAVSPITDILAGQSGDTLFQPSEKNTGKSLTTARFGRLLEEGGYQVLGKEDTGDATGRAWSEHGDLDRIGHDQGRKLALRIPEELRSLMERITDLLQSGWQQVKVITDHGWLLLPGGLPKHELPGYLTETRWGRCAMLKPEAKPSGLLLPWRWAGEVSVALAPGVSCYLAGMEYAHGGLSLQECVTPIVTVKQAEKAVTVLITEAKWIGLRCRITLDKGAPGLRVDLRTKAADPASSLTIGKRGKEVDAEGKASLPVEDDSFVGSAAFLVVVDPKGVIITKMPTTIGGE